MGLELPTPPPLDEFLPQVQALMLPAAGAAALGLLTFSLFGKYFRHYAVVLAVVAGVLAGNWATSPFPLEQWNEPTAPRHYLPKFSLLLMLLGASTATLVDRIQHFKSIWSIMIQVAVWLAHAAAIWVGSAFILPADLGNTFRISFVLASLVLWFTLDRLGQIATGAEVGLLCYLACATTGGLMLYAHYASFMDYSMILAFTFAGLMLVALNTGYDLRGAVPGMIGFLPGLITSGQLLSSNELPVLCFWLTSLLLLFSLPGLLPYFGRKLGRYSCLVRIAPVMIASLVILLYAAQYEKLPWEEVW